MPGNIGRDPMASRSPYTGTDFLDCGHERIRKQERPRDGKPELRTGLRVGRDAAWIVIGSPGYKTGTQYAEKAPLGSGVTLIASVEAGWQKSLFRKDFLLGASGNRSALTFGQRIFPFFAGLPKSGGRPSASTHLLFETTEIVDTTIATETRFRYAPGLYRPASRHAFWRSEEPWCVFRSR